MKKLLLNCLRILPVLLLAALSGVLFAYSIGTRSQDIAVVAFVPGFSLFLLMRIVSLLPDPPEPASDALDGFKIAVGAAAVILTVGLTGIVSAAIYALVGLQHAGVIAMQISVLSGAITACMLVAIIMKMSPSGLPEAGHHDDRKSFRRALFVCLVFAVFTLPSSFSGHGGSHHPISHRS